MLMKIVFVEMKKGEIEYFEVRMVIYKRIEESLKKKIIEK
jgi:hypothetical protein